MLYVQWRVLHEFLFVYLFFFLILRSLWHYCNILFVALLFLFIYEDNRLAHRTALNNALTHPVTSGIHDSKHAYILKADILNT